MSEPCPFFFAGSAILARSAGLLAQVGLSTFIDHRHLNCPEVACKPNGIVLHRANWCDRRLCTAGLLEVLWPALKKHLQSAAWVHSDDITMPLQEPGRGSIRTARLWRYLGAGKRREKGQWVDRPLAVLFEIGSICCGCGYR